MAFSAVVDTWPLSFLHYRSMGCACGELFFGASIRKSSSCLPSLNAMVSHLGFIPLPDHFSPSGPLYLGATFRLFLGPSRCSLLADEVRPVSRSICLWRLSARLLSSSAISSRNLQRA